MRNILSMENASGELGNTRSKQARAAVSDTQHSFSLRTAYVSQRCRQSSYTSGLLVQRLLHAIAEGSSVELGEHDLVDVEHNI